MDCWANAFRREDAEYMARIAVKSGLRVGFLKNGYIIPQLIIAPQSSTCRVQLHWRLGQGADHGRMARVAEAWDRSTAPGATSRSTISSAGKFVSAPRPKVTAAERQVQLAHTPVQLRAHEPPPQPAERWS
jgi:hypothetical protein